MTLQQLKYFVTVAECKNITSAAVYIPAKLECGDTQF